jgi:hypothetical protein
LQPSIPDVVQRAAHSPYAPVVFFVAFAVLWLAVTTGLMSAAGWFALTRRYLDSDGEPLAVFKGKSGAMGAGGALGRVNMSGVLNFWLLPQGLRVGLNPLFGAFCRPFVVPWTEISVERWRFMGLFPRARLVFGRPMAGAIDIDASLADRMARVAVPRWPETGPFPIEPLGQSLLVVGLPWVLMTAFVVTVWTGIPVLAGDRAKPPLEVEFLFSAVLAVASLIQLSFRRRP